MAERVVIEQFHITVFVPRGLSPAACRAVRRTLAGVGFRDRLGRAVRAVVRRHRSLDRTSVALSR